MASFLAFQCLLIYFILSSVDSGSLDVDDFLPYPQQWVINTSSLSVASVIYNPSSFTSPWVRRLLGEEAIFHNRSYTNYAGAHLKAREKYERAKVFSQFFSLPIESRVSSCSFELLTYGLVDYDHPLSHYYMYTAPSVGKATLTFYDDGESLSLSVCLSVSLS